MGRPAFGAAIGSTIAALAPLAAYEGGGVVPETALALVHKNEIGPARQPVPEGAVFRRDERGGEPQHHGQPPQQRVGA